MGETEISAIAHVIQLSVAPVFLLSGIGAMLAVMTNRLSRIIERARVLEARLEEATPDRIGTIEADLETLTHRARLIGPAITLCTATALLVCMVLPATSQSPVRMTLPAGVTAVSFGTAQRYKDASGKEMCAITQPLPDPPAFDRGFTEISYGVGLQPGVVKSASTQVIAPAEQGYLQRTPCNAFAPVKGGFSQTLLGSTIARLDKKPMQSGAYILRITVDGQTADVPFTIK